MPMAWDVTSLSAKPGSGGCTTDSAADKWAKCKAVYTFLTAQAKNASTYATSPLWSVVDGPWKLSSFSTTGNVTIGAEQGLLRQPQAEAVGRQVPAVHRRLDRVHRAEDRPARRRLHPVAGPAAEAGELGACRRPTRWAAATTCSRSTPSASTTPSPTSTTRRSASWSGSCTSGRPCRRCSTSPASIKAIYRGYAFPTSGPAPTTPPEPVGTCRPERERRPGPVPVQHRQGQVAADQPRLGHEGRRDDLPGPVQVRHRHQEGPAG